MSRKEQVIMEEYGFLSLLPPLLAIALALITKQTIISLFVGVWLGATIITGWNPLVGFVTVVTDFMIPAIADSWNAGLLILVSVCGGFVYMIKAAKGSQALAEYAGSRIKSRKSAMTITWFSAFAFLYTEPTLTLGTIMRPITDKFNVSRVKLAYILDSMGCNLAAMSPISSYGPFITGLIAAQATALGLSENPWSLYVQMLPCNFYGIFAMLAVLFVVRTNMDIGPMYEAENRAVKTGKLMKETDKPLVEIGDEDDASSNGVKMRNFAVPLLALFVSIFSVIFWSGDIAANGFRGSFLEANIVLAIITGFLVGALFAGIMAVSSKLMDYKTAADSWINGVIQLMIVPMILIMAWSIGGVAGEMHLNDFLITFADRFVAAPIIPALIFVIGAFIAFATGSSWGTWAIMMPLAIPMAADLGISVPLVSAAVVGGGLFGDQCSPISDTTIMSSTGAACDHIEHVRTQLPYGLVVGFGAIGGFLVAGATGANMAGLAAALVLVAGALFVMNRSVKARYAREER
ncbi:MAG: sodium:proton antiporter [Synergistales bacterium]|nr:sodium:proton antiporter [Synergistales bacterium]